MRELIRRGAEIALSAPEAWVAEIDRATMSSHGMDVVVDDPVLASALRRLNLTSVAHWAASNVRDPGAPVLPNVGAEPLGLSRELARRGWDKTTLDAYRSAQNAALQRWMSLAFDLTSDPAELRELLAVSARSIHEFFSATIVAIAKQLQTERDELTRGTHPERRETVSLVIEGAPINPRQASQQLGYDLDQRHRAAVIWSDRAEPDVRALDVVANAFGVAAGARPLTIIASAAILWVWVHDGGELERAPLSAAMRQVGSVRIAIGGAGQGVDGFRRSHLDALRAQRMVVRLGSAEDVILFDELRLALLLAQDPAAADEFVKHTLGDLAVASREIRASVLTFLREGCNASLAAERLRTHRNTLVRRLARADELLPRPLRENRIDVGVALEIQRWRGDRSLSDPAAPSPARGRRRPGVAGSRRA